MDKPFFQSDIPLHSTFTAQISGTGSLDAQAFTASGILRLADLSTLTWIDRELRDGVSVPLASPGVYDGNIDLVFARESTARVKLQIVQPDGTAIVFDEPVTKATGPDSTSVLLVTKKS